MTITAILPQLQRAQELHSSGRAAEAWQILLPLRRAIDNHGQALRLHALVAQEVGRIDDAIAALQRITVLERDPPEIIGAIGDLYGKLGRHAEALAHWDRLVALRPDLADAHLNRAVTAANAAQHQKALDAAEEGLRRFPDHARLLATKAMALKNVDRIVESVEWFERAVAADPNRALTRHNQAVALRAACRFDDACDAYEASGRLGMRGTQFHANWAAAALEAGRIDEAADLYRKALATEPGHQESLKALTRLQIEFRGGEDAFAHYQASVEARGLAIEAWRDWTSELLGHYRYQEALEVAERGLRTHPAEPTLEASAAFAAGMLDDAGPALQRIEHAYRGRADLPYPWMSQLAIRAGMMERAGEFAQRVLEVEPDNQGAWSALSVIWRLLDDPREDWLCDYDRLVMVTEVPPPDKSMSPADYGREVALALDPLHQTSAAPGDQSLRHGTQTSGNLFSRPEPEIRKFRDAVRIAAELMVGNLPDDPDHPFLRRKSRNLTFVGSWSVRLRGGGGHHVPHYHIQGWMSSAYYARLPTLTADQRAAREGWLELGAVPEMYRLDLPPRRIVEPQVGNLVLFPSYMLHGTIPFSAGDRLTAAFDYQPV